MVLAAAVLVYWALPARLRLGFLSLASAGYLATIAPMSVAGLAGWAVLFFAAARWAGTERTRGWVTPALIIGILGYLAYFKYIPPLLGPPQPDTKPLMILLGISFYSFKLIHYAVEVRRGNITESNLWRYFC